MRTQSWFVFIGMVAILGSVWIDQTRVSAGTIKTAPQANFSAPEFSLPALDGREIAIRELRGRAVLINFWATWCGPCRAEMIDFQDVYEKRHAEGFVILAINEGEDKNTVAQFARESRVGFSILFDRDGRVAKRYRVLGLPTSFFIDREGVIHTVNQGQINRAYIEAELDTLLGKNR